MVRRWCTAALLLGACFREEPDQVSETSSTADESSSVSTTETSTSGTATVSNDSSESSEGATTLGEGASSAVADTTSSDSTSSTGELPIEDYALYFDGASSAQSNEEVNFSFASDFTIEAWLRVDSTDATGSIAAHRGAGTTGWELSIGMGSALDFGFYDNNGVWNGVTGADLAELSPGWHHVAGTKHETSLYLHVDGDVSATASCSAMMTAPTVPLVVGTNAEEEALTFIAVDDLRISNIARYQSSFVPSEELDADPSTLVLLLFDEGDGTATLDEGSQALTMAVDGGTWVPGNTE